MSSGAPAGSLEPALVCEAPAEGVRYVHNVLEVSGWVRGLDCVKVRFAGVENDAALGPEQDETRTRRFTLRLAIAGTARGDQRLAVCGVGAGGRELGVERALVAAPYADPHPPTPDALARGEVTLATGPPALDGGAEVRAPVQIGGWCLATAGIDRVEAVLDGARRYDLAFPLVRRDVWRAVGRRDALLSGFGLVLDGAECPPGRHSLVVLATTSDGRTVGQSGGFTCLPGDGSATGLPEPDRLPVEPLTLAHVGPNALATLLKAVDGTWACGAAPLAAGRSVLVLADDGPPADAVLGPLREMAAELVVITDDSELADRADGSAGLVVAPSPRALDDARLAVLERLLSSDGVLLAVGNCESLAPLRARFPETVTWRHSAELRTALALDEESSAGRVVAVASRRPPPSLAPPMPEPLAIDLAALAEEHAITRLASIIAERQVLVSTLEGDVIALYHRELQRAAAELRVQLSRREVELAEAYERVRAAEQELRALRQSSSWRLTAPLRTLKRVVSGSGSGRTSSGTGGPKTSH